MADDIKTLVEMMTGLNKRLDKLEASFSGRPFDLGPVADPPPDGGNLPWPWPPRWPWPIPWPRPRPWPWLTEGNDRPFRIDVPYADPPPDELVKLSRVQLESRLDDIKAVRLRLDRLEKLYQEQIKAVG